MARAYSSDLRERVLRACEAGGESQSSMARRFAVSEATVSSWRKPAREAGRRQAKEHAGGRVMLAGDLPVLDEVAAQHPGARLAEYAALLAERTGRHHAPPALCRALQRLGWHRKKSPCTPASRSAPMFRRSARPGARTSPLGPPRI
jgi:transposase